MQDILFSIMLGGAAGAVWAALEVIVFFIGLRRAARRAEQELAGGADVNSVNKRQNIYIMRFFIGKYVLNVVLLLALFLCRNLLPYSWEIILLSAGIVLALMSQVLIVRFGVGKKQR
ncbi:MAG TPA: hypothetical protein IAB00_02075 [Candidatus Avidehalobacter gallistercoris]|uniref:Uncharacterized protein n=1 Tax=Candidatus Avidehalobacter gallistercoris TaxID=2840694 RepID=A0A9D1HJ32_9FIRM|nr:hypothetical protein [Candidatus Avidehalobacter gallistercoris]